MTCAWAGRQAAPARAAANRYCFNGVTFECEGGESEAGKQLARLFRLGR